MELLNWNGCRIILKILQSTHLYGSQYYNTRMVIIDFIVDETEKKIIWPISYHIITFKIEHLQILLCTVATTLMYMALHGQYATVCIHSSVEEKQNICSKSLNRESTVNLVIPRRALAKAVNLSYSQYITIESYQN